MGQRDFGWIVEMSLDPLDSDDTGIWVDHSTERAQHIIRPSSDSPIR